MNTPAQDSVDFGPATLGSLCERIRSLLARRAQPVVVAICGGSSVGKSTQLAAGLADRFKEVALRLELDHFQALHGTEPPLDPTYRWDHPEMYRLDDCAAAVSALASGRSAEIPLYDFATRRSLGFRSEPPRPLLIIEGMYANFGPLRPLIAFNIYVEAPLKARLCRRALRSMWDRYRNPEAGRTFEGFFRSVLPAHRAFVIQQRGRADAVVRMPYSFAEAIERFNIPPIDAPLPGDATLVARIDERCDWILCDGPVPSVQYRHDGALYLHAPIVPEARNAILACDPEEL